MPLSDAPIESCTVEEALRQRAHAAESSLASFRQVVRILTKQMKQTHTAQERTWTVTDPFLGMEHAGEEGNATASMLLTRNDPNSGMGSCQGLAGTICPEELNLCRMIGGQPNDCVADLLDLQNTVRMLQDHARLSLEEASFAQAAQVESEFWKEKAHQSEAVSQELKQENAELKAQVKQLSLERRLLIKECRIARKVAAEAEKICRQHELERNTMNALSIHERQLIKPVCHKGDLQSGNSTDVEEEKKADDEPVETDDDNRKPPQNDPISQPILSPHTPSEVSHAALVSHDTENIRAHQPLQSFCEGCVHSKPTVDCRSCQAHSTLTCLDSCLCGANAESWENDCPAKRNEMSCEGKPPFSRSPRLGLASPFSTKFL